MIFDPFKTFQTKGYLENIKALKDLESVKVFGAISVERNIYKALENLRKKSYISYKDIQKVHEILFSSIYPWAGKDRSVTAPDIAITKAGHNTMFAHPHEVKLAADYALEMGNNVTTMQAKPGEVMGMLAHSHPFLDGNGRTIMIIHYELCRRARISIEWEKINKQDYLKALTDELEAPGKQHLDTYLTPFIQKKVRAINYSQTI